MKSSFQILKSTNLLRYKRKLNEQEKGGNILNLISTNFSSYLFSSSDNERVRRRNNKEVFYPLLKEENNHSDVRYLSNDVFRSNERIALPDNNSEDGRSIQLYSWPTSISFKMRSSQTMVTSRHPNMISYRTMCGSSFPLKRISEKETNDVKRRCYSTSTKRSSPTLILIGAGLCTSAYILSFGLKQYEAYQERKAREPSQADIDRENKGTTNLENDTEANGNTDENINYSKSESNRNTDGENVDDTKSKGGENSTDSADNDLGNYFNTFTAFFDFSSKKYYEGGFEDKMTKREAALILGVRISADAKRIKAQHKKILILNHPDRGGSTYLATKVNEAKELLLKGKE